MGILRTESSNMKLLLPLLLFTLLFFMKQGTAGGEEQTSYPQNCVELASAQNGMCLIPVIVELDISKMPNVDNFSNQQDKKTSVLIQAVQDLVLIFMEDQNTANVRRYKLLPQIALSTDGNGIVKILSNPHVIAIFPDRKLSANEDGTKGN